jgi:hypothetical protein
MQVVTEKNARVTNDALSPTGIWDKWTNYFGDLWKLTDGPQAFLVEKRPSTEALEDGEAIMSKPHFHRARQYQLVIEADRARIGKHPTPAYSFHYTDPGSPYGPIVAGEGGISFFTLRPQSDIGTYWMPAESEKMRGHAGRNVVCEIEQRPLPSAGVETETLVDRHEDGLAAFQLRLGPNEHALAPDPKGSGGQYLYVIEGWLAHRDERIGARCLVWVSHEDEPARLAAGPEGADVLVMQFPLPMPDQETIDFSELAPVFVEANNA